MVHASSDTWESSQIEDDCLYVYDAPVWVIDYSYVGVGDYSVDSYDYRSGMRFQGITIPQGSTIISAYLNLTASHLYGVIPEITIYGQDADTTSIFSTSDDFLARDRTDSSVAWTPSTWVANTEYKSEDIKAIIQEIVDRPGWGSGNSIVLFIEEPDGWGSVQNMIRAWSYDVGHDIPQLIIEWSLPSIYVKFYQNLSNGYFYTNSTTLRTNGTQAAIDNGTVLRLECLPNSGFGFTNFTWDGSHSTLNRYNLTVTGNTTIWMNLFNGTSNGDGDGIAIEFVTASIFLFFIVFTPLIVIILRRR